MSTWTAKVVTNPHQISLKSPLTSTVKPTTTLLLSNGDLPALDVLILVCPYWVGMSFTQDLSVRKASRKSIFVRNASQRNVDVNERERNMMRSGGKKLLFQKRLPCQSRHRLLQIREEGQRKAPPPELLDRRPLVQLDLDNPFEN